MKKDITELFCFIDDICKYIKDAQKEIILENSKKPRKPTRIPGLIDSEIITILMLFHRSPCKNFKYFYQSYLQLYHSEFPQMPTYERFVILQQRILPMLTSFLNCIFIRKDNVAFIDSTPLSVCHNKRNSRNKVFKGLAETGKSTKGWFHGFKMHAIVDRKGNLMNIKFTKGNAHDISVVEKISSFFKGILVGDKGYISKDLFQNLYQKGVKLVTGSKKNMKNILMNSYEKFLLKKRSIIETVFGYLKEIQMIEHHRHRSPVNMFIHVISTLISYQLKSSKPSLTDYLALA